MTDLEKYNKVNECETLEQLAMVIESFADDTGSIQGRNRKFNANKMADYCRNFSWFHVNLLTRNWGIRQQAMLCSFYENGLPVINK